MPPYIPLIREAAQPLYPCMERDFAMDMMGHGHAWNGRAGRHRVGTQWLCATAATSRLGLNHWGIDEMIEALRGLICMLGGPPRRAIRCQTGTSRPAQPYTAAP